MSSIDNGGSRGIGGTPPPPQRWTNEDNREKHGRMKFVASHKYSDLCPFPIILDPTPVEVVQCDKDLKNPNVNPKKTKAPNVTISTANSMTRASNPEEIHFGKETRRNMTSS